MGDFLNANSLEWAASHIQKFGDTNLFPRPFEYDAIRGNWRTVKENLIARDLGTYKCGPITRRLTPKVGRLFRVAHQLDPLDSLIYTAIAFEAGSLVEKARVDRSARVACSYRIDINADGNFFASGTGWPDFQSRSKELAESGQFAYVLLADITDFYNQTYHHRIENALENASVPAGRAKNTETFLTNLTALTSRGLPVGPRASIILSEALLTDVDNFLLNRSINFVRYVDDFRIFCRTNREATNILHYLTEYLYTSHRLSLQTNKTVVLCTSAFLLQELAPSGEEVEKNRKEKELRRIIDEILRDTGYSIDIDELPDEEVRKIVSENLSALFEAGVRNGKINYTLLRYVLSRASALRIRHIYGSIFENLQRLVPIFSDVCHYLLHTMPNDPTYAEPWGRKLRDFVVQSDVGDLPFIQHWVLHILAENPQALPYSEAIVLAKRSENTLGIRPAALLARAHRKIDWVRSQKENWQNYGPWDLRSIVWAASVLPPDERRVWLRLVRENSDLLTQCVALHANK